MQGAGEAGGDQIEFADLAAALAVQVEAAAEILDRLAGPHTFDRGAVGGPGDMAGAGEQVELGVFEFGGARRRISDLLGNVLDNAYTNKMLEIESSDLPSAGIKG